MSIRKTLAERKRLEDNAVIPQVAADVINCIKEAA